MSTEESVLLPSVDPSVAFVNSSTEALAAGASASNAAAARSIPAAGGGETWRERVDAGSQ